MTINILENIALQYSHTPTTDKQFRLQIWQSIGNNIVHLLHNFNNKVPVDIDYGIQPPYLPITEQSIQLIENKITEYEKRLQLSLIQFKTIDNHKCLVIKGKSQHKNTSFACEFLFKVKYKFGLVCFSIKSNT